VVFMGIISGLVGNSLAYTPRPLQKETCPHCHTETTAGDPHKHSRTPARLVFDVLKYAFWEMPKELGLEILIGIALAAVVSSFFPVGYFIKHYLSGWLGYLFSVVVGVFMYVCSTASVPLVHAFVRQGLSAGAGMVLLLLGPITSYGTMLVLKKEFGARILIVYLILVITLSLALGIGYQYFFSLPMAAQ
ncbi:MAG: permease, partial [Candidatus Omnitrophota bacterium]